MYVELPAIETSTPDERLEALKEAKTLMSGNEATGGFGAMLGSKSAPGASADAIDGFIRLAEYITTGHDYRDTHPEGKRRPIIHEQHIHVHPVALDLEDEDMPEDLREMFAHIMDHHTEDEPKDAGTFPNPWATKPEDPSPEADPARDSDTPPPAFKL